MIDFDLKTSGGGRGYLARLFREELKRHDFNTYIQERIAADFACVMSEWLDGVLAERDQLRAEVDTLKGELAPGLYAIHYRDNWDGQGDRYYLIAEKDSKGRWLNYESTKELLEYEGDAILRAWALTDECAAPLPSETPAAQDVSGLVEALEEIVKQYPNPDVAHIDYRVHACRHAELALAEYRAKAGE